MARQGSLGGMRRVSFFGWLLVVLHATARQSSTAQSQSKVVSGSRPSVRLYLFVRDQPEMLEDWVRFHAHVFSAANIVIVDHQTTDPLAKQVLAPGL